MKRQGVVLVLLTGLGTWSCGGDTTAIRDPGVGGDSAPAKDPPGPTLPSPGTTTPTPDAGPTAVDGKPFTPQPSAEDAATGAARDVASVDAGAGNPDLAPPMVYPDDKPPAGWVPAIVGVGYAGIRVLSLDLGKSWPVHPQLAASGGDDGNLLRSVAYGKGLWLAGGWKHFVSQDGATWMPRPLPAGCGLMEGVAYGNGIFVATCGYGDAFISSDGLNWKRGKQGLPTGIHFRVVFGQAGGVAQFAAAGDTGTSFVSPDGVNWTLLPGVQNVRYCDGQFRSQSACGGGDTFQGHGISVRQRWPSRIERSQDGRTWTDLYTAPNPTVWFAFGYAPPK